MMEAPASAAAMDCSAISFGVIGRWGDMLGVWIEPVVAQVMMTLPHAAMLNSPVLASQRSSGGTFFIGVAKAAWASASTGLLTTRVDAGFSASLAFGRIGLGLRPPPQLGHTFMSSVSTQA